jgi:putative hydrolase of the HAD superfamily
LKNAADKNVQSACYAAQAVGLKRFRVTERPRAILFDLDGTLIHYRELRDQLSEIMTAFENELIPLTSIEVVAAIEKEFALFWSDLSRHKDWSISLRNNRRDVCARAVRSFNGKLPDADGIAHRIADALHERRDSDMGVFPGAFETVEALKREGIRLALITNGPSESQRRKVATFDLSRHFEHIQIEEEFGAGKPEEHVYLHAMSVLGVAPQETWMVGDNLEYDVGAPQRLGIFGIWHDGWGRGLPSTSSTKPDRVITRLKQLLD